MIVKRGDVVMYLPRSTLKAGKQLMYDIGTVCDVQERFVTLRLMDGSVTVVYVHDIVCVCKQYDEQ